MERKRILLIGSVNSGKSTLFNCILRQKRSLISNVAGTTTDSIEKVMELASYGPIVLVDTPGLGDSSLLGKERERSTEQVLSGADLLLYLITKQSFPLPEQIRKIPKSTPIFPVISKADSYSSQEIMALIEKAKAEFSIPPLPISVANNEGIEELLQLIPTYLQKKEEPPALLGSLCQKGDLVMLVMPQDASAPQGRLILPQVRTIRALLDRGCHALCTTPEELSHTLSLLATPPRLIITDSQVFGSVEKVTPQGTLLTSFSILMSAERGDIKRFVAGAKALESLTEYSHVLIAEACTHTPQGEDIGTVKIPHLLRRRLGENLRISFVSGKDFPEDLSPYDAIIHCGGCMFNRQLLISRQDSAEYQGVPMTNYGIAIAFFTGILDKVVFP